jgi:pimeloyl-ACP methyl ester carboxylesterase
MGRVKVNGLEIEYELFGPETGRPLLLIMGIGVQMIGWPDPFCQKLADQGHFVIRFDNRDVGLSTKMEEGGLPHFMAAQRAYNQDQPVEAPYTLSDMAADSVGLLDALGVAKAHICGLSLGGMIAQTIAIEFPHRVLSLISMESSTSEKDLPPPTPEAMKALLTPPPAEREAHIRHLGQAFRTFSDNSDLYDETMEKELSARAYERCFFPPGFVRQYVARLASGGRKKALASLQIPTLVIHGTRDALLPPEHGRATATAVPEAKLHLIDGLGHGLSFPLLWDQLVKAISEHTTDAT